MRKRIDGGVFPRGGGRGPLGDPDARKRLLLCLGPPLFYLVAFLILPYVNLLKLSFFKIDLYTIVADINLQNYYRIIDNPLYRQVIRNSLEIACIVTACAVLVGYPVAYFLAFVAGRSRQLLYFMVIVPLWTSLLLRAFMWKLILGHSGLLNGVLTWLGVVDQPVQLFLYNRFSVCLTLVYIFIPFVVLPVYTALERIPREYVEASLDLGAGYWRTFRRVILPLSLPGVLAGAIFTFTLSFGDFVTPTLLGGPDGIMISNVMIGQFGAAFDWPFGSALAVVVLSIALAVVMIAGRVERRPGVQVA